MSDNLLSFSKMLQEQDKKEKENWATRRPELGDQTTSVGDQTTRRPDDQKYKSRTERTRIGVRLPAHKVEKYRIYCFVNKISLQDAIEKGLDWVTGGLVDQTTTINDLIDIDDNLIDEDIISLYARWTKNKVTEKDRKAAEGVSHLAPHIVKTGILISIIRAKTKINSFKYCLGAIEEAAETNAGPEYFGYLLEQMKRKG